MNLEAVAAGSSAMAVFAWSSHRVDARFNLGLKLLEPLAVLVALAAGTILAFAQLPAGLHLRIALLLGVAAVCAVTDIQTGYIFDRVTLPAFGLLMILSVVQHTILDTFLGGMAAASALLLLFVISHGRGIGLGDVKFALCIGAAFGVRGGLLSLCVSFVLGGCVASIFLLSGKGRKSEIRFGPFLALGSAVLAVVNP